MQFDICSGGAQEVVGFLGLQFKINGQTHYGWAQVDIEAFYGRGRSSMSTTLIGFAYESTPDQAINTG